ncbi:hypothetical protein U0L90_05980 [Flavobacteriaceae sp. LMIT009]
MNNAPYNRRYDGVIYYYGMKKITQMKHEERDNEWASWLILKTYQMACTS